MQFFHLKLRYFCIDLISFTFGKIFIYMIFKIIMEFWDRMILDLLKLVFSSFFSFGVGSDIVEMSFSLVKFYFWYHWILGYKKIPRKINFKMEVMQFTPK